MYLTFCRIGRQGRASERRESGRHRDQSASHSWSKRGAIYQRKLYR